jgi:hypothetical protein
MNAGMTGMSGVSTELKDLKKDLTQLTLTEKRNRLE